MRAHGSYVGVFLTEQLGVYITHQVVVVTPIEIGYEVQAVAQETEVDTEVELVFLLVGQFFVGILCQFNSRFLLVTSGTPEIGGAEDGAGIRGGALLTSQRVTQTQCGVRHGTTGLLHPFLEEWFLVGVPCS